MPAEKKHIGTFVHLKQKPDAERALKTLQRVACHVMPILQARSWHVRTLAEFYPEQTNLLGTNLNRDQKISLRLRQPFDDGSHLEFEDVMGTMLHELAHIIRGPHDEQFYKVLDELNLEYDKLLSSSAGKFLELGEGRTVGGRVAGSTPAAARQAALRRQRGTGLQGQVLGGAPLSSLSAKERAAEAAQRRLFDAKWCGHGRAEDPILVDEEEEVSNDEDVLQDAFRSVAPSATKDAKTVSKKPSPKKPAAPEIILIDSDDDTAAVVPPAFSKTKGTSKRKREEDDYARMKQRNLLNDSLDEHLTKLAANKPARGSSAEASSVAALPKIPGRWYCGVCTLANRLGDPYCDACGAERPSAANQVGDYWICETCSQFNEKSMWMCIQCQSIKKSS